MMASWISFQSGYEAGTDNFIISYNETDYEPVYPDAPAEVTAEAAEKGQVMVKWPAAYLSNGNVAVHNVYIRNNETGAVGCWSRPIRKPASSWLIACSARMP